MSKPLKITTDHVTLDVKLGRKSLEKHLVKGGTASVTIQGTITWGDQMLNDDGVSIEYYVKPEKVSVSLETPENE